MKALILAAGAGTRIRPLSAERPKGLMPIVDLPPIYRLRAKLHEAGVDDVWMNSHAHTVLLEASAAELTEMGMPTRVSVESKMLGTAGAVFKLRNELTDPFLILNADIITSLNLKDLIQSHEERGAFATL